MFCRIYEEQAESCSCEYTPIPLDLDDVPTIPRSTRPKTIRCFLIDQRAIENMVRAILWARLQYAHRWVTEAEHEAYKKVSVEYGHNKGCVVFRLCGLPPKHVGQYWQKASRSQRWQALELKAELLGKLTPKRVQRLVNVNYSTLPKRVKRVLVNEVRVAGFETILPPLN